MELREGIWTRLVFFKPGVDSGSKSNQFSGSKPALEKERENSGIYYWRKEELPWELLFVYVDARRSMTLNIFLTYAYGLQSKI